ncbi:MAG: PP0621 family protein [Burkholderiaceae bacterium]
MVKLLLMLGFAVLALMLWFGKGRGGGAARPSRRVPGPQAMVACAHCGVHLPQLDAVDGDSGQHYCSAEHRRLGPRKGP